MDNKKVKWCLEQKRGIKLVGPNRQIAEAYMKDANEDLQQMLHAVGKWKIITAHYACYESLYAILQLAGIKSEMHDCTLALIDLFSFPEGQKKLIYTLKKEREEVQYYLAAPKNVDRIKVKEFVLKCKTILNQITTEDIEKIRKELGEKEMNKKQGITLLVLGLVVFTSVLSESAKAVDKLIIPSGFNPVNLINSNFLVDQNVTIKDSSLLNNFFSDSFIGNLAKDIHLSHNEKVLGVVK